MRAIAVNASAVFLLSRAVVKPMLERKWGRIINVTTSLGTMLHGGWTPYGPSKASAEALSAVMAADLEGTGVTVNVVIPGGTVNTPMIPKEAPFARDALLQPDIMLPPLLWLVSPAADHVTGKRFLGSAGTRRTWRRCGGGESRCSHRMEGACNTSHQACLLTDAPRRKTTAIIDLKPRRPRC